MRKIYAACKLHSLSREFLFLNDDHFILKPLGNLPYYHKGSLENTLDTRGVQDRYYQSLRNTLRVLETNLLPTNNFDVHTPIVYNKLEFPKVMDCYDWSIHSGYVVKSLYCNTLRIVGEYIEDIKINTRFKCREIDAIVNGKPFFSVGDGSVGSEMEMFLQYLFPKKSKFER